MTELDSFLHEWRTKLALAPYREKQYLAGEAEKSRSDFRAGEGARMSIEGALIDWYGFDWADVPGTDEHELAQLEKACEAEKEEL